MRQRTVIIFTAIIVSMISMIPVAKMKGEINGLEDQNEILYKIACDNPNKFKQLLFQMKAPTDNINSIFKSNSNLWEAAKQKMLAKCH